MKPLTRDEILDLVEYERRRADYLPRLIEYKKTRRVRVGDELGFIFENRETVRFQIQEMLRTERAVDEAAIQAEIDVYNELVPAAGGLSATLMIEIPDTGRIRETLDRLVGIDEHVWIEVGDASVGATFDPKQFEDDRIAAVQYVRFPLGEHAAALCDATVPARLRASHPALRAHTSLEGAVRASLTRDLGSDPEPSLLGS